MDQILQNIAGPLPPSKIILFGDKNQIICILANNILIGLICTTIL
jgi:hypothetical protein